MRALVLFLLATLFFAPLIAQADTVNYPTRPSQHFYVDDAHLIDAATGSKIDAIAKKLLAEKQVPIIVATIPSLSYENAGNDSIKNYASALFNHWGIGSKNRNYGILLLISSGDKQARIELGNAWGHSYDAKTQQIMDTLIVPEFRQGNFSAGILAGVVGMDAMARGLNLPTPPTPPWLLPAMIIGGLLIVFVIVSLFRSGRKGWGWLLIAAIGMLLLFALRNSARGGFGGGFSGGGGASGSW